MLYNYNGDSMNSTNVIISINNLKDIAKIDDSTKYINLPIDKVNINVVDYFLLHGQKYSYSDIIDSRNGFIYTSYDMLKNSERIIDEIIDEMPTNLNTLEKVRYLYIKLGQIVTLDINSISTKNETISFKNINTINNVWGALSKGKVTEISAPKILMYLCSRIGLKSELISNNLNGHLANKIYLENSSLIVDISNDLHNIQGGFITNYFDKFNNNIDMDKKIFYIKENYMNHYLDELLTKIDYTSENVVYEILTLTESIIDINKIGTVELSKIYKNIFDKYCPNYDIKINNFFLYDNANTKDHFITISYNNQFYSFNYSKRKFINISLETLLNNLNNNKIGLYSNEDFNFKEKELTL